MLDLSTRIDSRDLIDRLNGLCGSGADWRALDGASLVEDDGFDPDDHEEIVALVSAIVALANNSDGDTPEDGVFAVAESEWVAYAKEFAEDIGAVPSDREVPRPWPHCHIDWDAAARSLALDYTLVTIDGTDYYVR